MKNILGTLLICVLTFSLFGCNKQKESKEVNKEEIIDINKENYQDYLDIDLEVDIHNDLIYRWVITPLVIYDDYEFKDTVVYTRNNNYYPDSDDGDLDIKLTKFGYTKTCWIDSPFALNAISSNPIQFLEKYLEIENVVGQLVIKNSNI